MAITGRGLKNTRESFMSCSTCIAQGPPSVIYRHNLDPHCCVFVTVKEAGNTKQTDSFVARDTSIQVSWSNSSKYSERW